MITTTLYRWLITTVSFVLVSLVIYFDPDTARSLLRGSDEVMANMTSSVGGYGGLVADVLADGLLLVLAATILLCAVAITFITKDRRCWCATKLLFLLPIAAGLVMVCFSSLGWDGWLTTVGRNLSDMMPQFVQSWGKYLNLELRLQFAAVTIGLLVMLTVWQLVRKNAR